MIKKEKKKIFVFLIGKTYSNTKNNILVPVIRNTVRKNIPVCGADIKYPSQ